MPRAGLIGPGIGLAWKNQPAVRASLPPLRHGGSQACRGQSCEPKGTAGASGVLSWRKQNLVREKEALLGRQRFVPPE